MFKSFLNSDKSNAQQKSLGNIKSALDEVSAAVMMVDRDFIVTYVNNASHKLFTEHAAQFKAAFPHFDPHNIIGTCIDVFHRNPAHQRKMLADPSILPFKTDIKLGDLVIALYVTATRDSEGNYSGNVLEWRDVTAERQRLLQDLDNAGQLAAIDRAQGTIELGMDGRVLKANDILLKTMGYSLQEAVGQYHSVFVGEEYAKTEAYREFWAKLNRGEFVSGRFKRFAKSGKEIWLEASYNPIFDTQGKPYKVVKYATDITESIKIAETAKTLSLVANETDNSVVITDANGLIEYVNAGFSKLTGFSLEEVVGKKPGSFLQGPLTDKETVKRISDNLKAQKPFYDEILNYTKKGESYWISLAVNPVFNDKGKLDKFVSIQTNIQSTKLTSIEFTERLKAISRSSAMIEFTPQGQILDANENLCQTMGYSKQEIVGHHHRMFVAPELHNSSEYLGLWAKLASGEFDAGVYKRIKRSGEEVVLQASYNPIFDQEGRVVKVVKFATDITEQHNAAAALQKAVAESQTIIQQAQIGDLRNRVSLEGKSGAIASLCEGINALMDKMTEVISQVKEAGDTINTAATEIASGNTDLSSRTEQQAASLEETASSMEQLAGTVKQNAENAKQANQLAMVASDVAVRGGEVVSEVVTTMAQINSSSRKIEDIISVIDGIAFQTNILALNAAVEAARAGEQGRGFAVVAGEVRNLAQRSATAAKEIKQLIFDSVTKVQEGTKLVEDAGKTMGDIVTSVKRVTDIMGEISLASTEQSSGINQVNVALSNMDEVTQQNSALVEEAAAAAESLVEQAMSLMATVNSFKIDHPAFANARSANSSTWRSAPALSYSKSNSSRMR